MMSALVRRLLVGLVFLSGTATFVVTSVRLASAPVRFDEADTVFGMEATARYGSPRVPAGVDPLISVLPDPFQRRRSERAGAPHPPLHLYSVSLAGRLLGFGDVAVRLTGVAWLGLTLGALWLAVQGADGGTWPLVVGLIGLSPLLREGALFVDIDNTALTTFTFLFLALFLRYEDRRDAWAVGGLALGLCLCLWTKLTTPVLMLAAAGLYQLARGRPWFGAVQLGAVTLAGVGLFAATYAAYCVAFDYPWRYMFAFTFVAKRGQYMGQAGLGRMLQSARWNLVWTSPALTLAVLTAFLLRARHWVHQRRVERMDLFVLFATLGVAAYVVKTATVGKYTYPAVVAGLLVVAAEGTRGLRSAALRRPLVLGAALVGLGVAAAAFVPNLQFKPPRSIADTARLAVLIGDPRMAALAAGTGLALAAGVAGLVALSTGSRGHALLTGLVLGAAVLNPIDAWKGLLRGYDGRAPLRPYREDGYLATVDYLTERCRRGDVVMAPKDLGNRLVRSAAVRYIPLEFCWEVLGVEGVRRTLNDHRVRFLVTVTYLTPDPGFVDQAGCGYLGARRVGDFTVHEFDR
jgi:hypothetical protein